MSSLFDFDGSQDLAYNAKTAGRAIVNAKHAALQRVGDFVFLAHSEKEFALRCQMVDSHINEVASNKLANVSDSKGKLVRAMFAEWQMRHARCQDYLCKTAEHPDDTKFKKEHPFNVPGGLPIQEPHSDDTKFKKEHPFNVPGGLPIQEPHSDDTKFKKEHPFNVPGGLPRQANLMLEQQILRDLEEIKSNVCSCGASAGNQFNGQSQCSPGEGCASDATPGACPNCGTSFHGHNVCGAKGCSMGMSASEGDQKMCAQCDENPATNKDVHGYLELCNNCAK